ncbi:transcriptional regulator [Streptomyces litchfieldiae]|uniref:Transcriptional regulator n=1 Tax=Streptomyces litchfieldiae TaxID=3075543 RepID=A0ABU2N0X8_9ACTN|nr:transcriptional regulator [Streptomyces sp. DSM 44938]MDT0347561.1 transcriptional regulator [Streptomyces sp. DSM 44938]
MAGRWNNFGFYGARGVPGWVALGREMDRQVTGIKSPVDSARGLAARLRYLTRSPAGMESMRRAGITARQRTIDAWVEKKQKPRRANLQKIDAAYWDLRRRNLGVEWARRLAERGTRIEIHPVDQSQVQAQNPTRVRDIPVRRMTVRGHRIWDDIIQAWIDEDGEMLDIAWDEIITDIGSDYDAYSHVASIGFGI